MARQMNFVNTLLIGAAALHTALAASLADFIPRVTDLPSSCNSIYTSQINGCVGSDFNRAAGNTCSTSCVNALDALYPKIVSACESDNISGNNIIVAFLAGDGPAALCPNNHLSTGASSSSAASSTSASASSTSAQASSTQTSSNNADPDSAPSTTTSSSATTSDSSARSTVTDDITSTIIPTSVASSLSMDTSSAPHTASSSSTSSSTTSGPSAQETSGGQGSPFDTYQSGATTKSDLPVCTLVGAAIVLVAMNMGLR